MNDEWRLQLDFEDEGHVARLADHLQARELKHDLSDAFHDRVIVTWDGATVFLYAETRDQVERSQALVEKLAAEHGWMLKMDLRRWHPEALDWEDPEKPLASGREAEIEKHAALIAIERERLERTGEPEFEVRVDLPSHRQAHELAERLRAEGLPAVRRWRYLVVGAADEDEAKALAKRLEGEVPTGSEVTAEGSARVAWGERCNPYAVFGGLGC